MKTIDWVFLVVNIVVFFAWGWVTCVQVTSMETSCGKSASRTCKLFRKLKRKFFGKWFAIAALSYQYDLARFFERGYFKSLEDKEVRKVCL